MCLFASIVQAGHACPQHGIVAVLSSTDIHFVNTLIDMIYILPLRYSVQYVARLVMFVL